MKKSGYAAWMMILAVTLAGCGAGGKTDDTPSETPVVSGQERAPADDGLGGEADNKEDTFTGEVVSHVGAAGSIALTIPDGWQYEITEKNDEELTHDGIRFWPEGKDGKIGLYYYDTGFSVCGTGLEEKEMTLDNGQKINMGVYDNSDVWEFITFVPDDEASDAGKTHGTYVARAEGIDEWGSRLEDEALEILATAQLGEDQTAAVTDFSVRLFQECAAGEDNCLISPLSVLEVLAMTANGAGGETLDQMEHVFGTSLPQLNPYFYSFNNTLPQGDDYKLSVANSIWAKDDGQFKIKQEFLDANAKWYGAEVRQEAFDDGTLRDINEWVRNNTDGMIPEILDFISPETMLYLINAVAFEADWQKPYTEDDVRDGMFTLADGTGQDVKMMYSTEQDYLRDEKAQGFIKYYADRKYAFAALLPDEGVSMTDYIASLDGETLHAMLKNPVDAEVHAAIPEFESEYSVSMENILTRMGMQDAFNAERADFTGIGGKPGDICISQVVHKTYISVDRKGTKAAAAAAVDMLKMALYEEADVKYVYLDRPFLYMLIDCETDTPVFIGVINKIN